jgi:hypothetical protein
METFTVALVVWFSFANPDFGDGFREARTPGLTEDECKAAAKLGHYPLANAPSGGIPGASRPELSGCMVQQLVEPPAGLTGGHLWRWP